MTCLRCHKPFLAPDQMLHGLHPECFCDEFKVEPQTDFRDLFETTSNSGPKARRDTAFKRINSSFFHGRYRKYSGALGAKNFIIKMQEPEFPELPAIEFVSNQLARVLGLQLPGFHFIYFQNQAYAFLSRNLMDVYAPATLDHIYKFLSDDSQFNCQDLCAVIQRETGRLSDVHRFVELCLFDALIGNNDRHGRNLAFLTKSGGVRTLSPFYDNPSYVGIADSAVLGTDLQPRGAIFTSSSTEPKLSDYVSEFKNLKFTSVVDRFRQKVIVKSQVIFETVQLAVALSPPRKNALTQLIENRMQELENG